MMAEADSKSPLFILAGTPNCGKSSLFNALTGSNQKIGNYPGVTVERREGFFITPSKKEVRILDLPGAMSMESQALDQKVIREILVDQNEGDLILAVCDASQLERSLSFVLELKKIGKPIVLALNMFDLAQKRGLKLDLKKLSEELGVLVVPTIATSKAGMQDLLTSIDRSFLFLNEKVTASKWVPSTPLEIRDRLKKVDEIIQRVTLTPKKPDHFTDRVDDVLTHPVLGFMILALMMALIFQAIFTWAGPAQDLIEESFGALGEWASSMIPNAVIASFVSEAVFGGVGGVLVFLPQILILFFFVLLLEESGYLARAAFMLDRVFRSFGLHGKSVFPLLSSYACAIPGMMSARTIDSERDRLITILVAPFTTCAARLPVYALLIAAFIPEETLFGVFTMQGVTLFALYFGGLAMTLLLGLIFKKTLFSKEPSPFFLELPTYKVPTVRNLVRGLWDRAMIFLKRVGTIILSISALIWVLSSYPKAPVDATEPAVSYSYAGMMGKAIEPLFSPLGFDWRISTGLIPGMAAREVMVSALATTYAIEGDSPEDALSEKLRADYSMPVALSLLAWFMFAPQCISTIFVMKRETQSSKWTWFYVGVAFLLAYSAALITYQATRLIF